jgi:hypothetical protein
MEVGGRPVRGCSLKRVDGLNQQAILEAEPEDRKPLIPTACPTLDDLLVTPVRYSRIRAAAGFPGRGS